MTQAMGKLFCLVFKCLQRIRIEQDSESNGGVISPNNNAWRTFLKEFLLRDQANDLPMHSVIPTAQPIQKRFGISRNFPGAANR